jgi:hypothetical protein
MNDPKSVRALNCAPDNNIVTIGAHSVTMLLW